MALYYNGQKVRNLYYNGKCITRLALGKEMTRLVEGDDFVRAEWLKGDGSAYIDTNIIVNVATLKYKLDCNLGDTPSCIMGSRDGNGSNSSSVSYLSTTKLRLDIFQQEKVNIFSGNGYIEVDVPNKYVDVNGTQYTTTRTSFDNSTYTFRIFDLYYRNNYNEIPCGLMRIGRFTINDGIHNLSLTPVRLLRPIPAALDGNGIARNAGECGMYDSVNGLFYGNVAPDGSFTVSDN